MKYLELKIPPLLLTLLFAGFMWLIATTYNHYTVNLKYNVILGLGILSVAIAILFASAYCFKKARTTVNPTKPNTSSTLVISGIYRYTRNPMYLSFSLILIAWAVFLSNIPAFMSIPLFIIYLTYFQIKPEEVFLFKIFGQAFSAYKVNVRRWI